MHNILYEPTEPAHRFGNRRGSTVVAVMLLSLGVGASTAAFTLVNGVMPHSAPFVTCETTIEYTSNLSEMPAAMATLDVATPAELQDRISDAYQTSYESAGDAVDSWSETASDVGDVGDVGGRVLAVMLGAGALALLVVCTRGAARALGAPHASTLFAGAALGALPVAAALAGAFGLPALGMRAVAFLIAVSVIAAYSARVDQKTREAVATAPGGR